jgi:hypothetical protein
MAHMWWFDYVDERGCLIYTPHQNPPITSQEEATDLVDLFLRGYTRAGRGSAFRVRPDFWRVFHDGRYAGTIRVMDHYS